MRCFYHNDNEAVGVCKSCGKGLCLHCAIDLGKGLACRDKCEAEAKAVIALIEANIRLTPRAEKSLSRSQNVISNAAIFNLILGAIFIAWGISDIEQLKFVFGLGICFFVYGLTSLVRTREQKQ